MSDVKCDTALKIVGGSNELRQRSGPAAPIPIDPCSQSQIVLWKLEEWNDSPEGRMEFLLEEIEYLMKDLEDQWDERERYEIFELLEMHRVEVRKIAASFERAANNSQAQPGHNATDSASVSRPRAPDTQEPSRNYGNWLKFQKSKRIAIVPAPKRTIRVKTKTPSSRKRRILSSFAFQIKALFGRTSFVCKFTRRR